MYRNFFDTYCDGRIKLLPKHTKAINHLKQVWRTHNGSNWDYLQSQIERIEKFYLYKLSLNQKREFNAIKSAFMATYKDKLGGGGNG